MRSGGPGVRSSEAQGPTGRFPILLFEVMSIKSEMKTPQEVYVEAIQRTMESYGLKAQIGG